MLTVSRENECRYCVPIYSKRAGELGMDVDIVDAIRGGAPIDDKRLAALHDLAVALVRERGNVPRDARRCVLRIGLPPRRASRGGRLRCSEDDHELRFAAFTCPPRRSTRRVYLVTVGLLMRMQHESAYRATATRLPLLQANDRQC